LSSWAASTGNAFTPEFEKTTARSPGWTPAGATKVAASPLRRPAGRRDGERAFDVLHLPARVHSKNGTFAASE
jgi:hypothetical protein